MGYSIEDYAAELRAIVAETDNESTIMSRVRVAAGKLAANRDAWLKPEHFEYLPERGSGLHVLHEEPDHSLMVFAACFKPGKVTPIHDHGTWAVVAGVSGEETNTIFKRIDAGEKPGHADIEQRGAKTFGFGDVLCMPAGTFHTVTNNTDEVSVSLHTYGMNTNHTQRFQVDPDSGALTEFKIPLR